jgi:hypothetical protein
VFPSRNETLTNFNLRNDIANLGVRDAQGRTAATS